MQVATIDYGMKKKKEMYYYKKDKPDDAFELTEDQVNYCTVSLMHVVVKVFALHM